MAILDTAYLGIRSVLVAVHLTLIPHIHFSRKSCVSLW